jgi:hypothetical protein
VRERELQSPFDIQANLIFFLVVVLAAGIGVGSAKDQAEPVR